MCQSSKSFLFNNFCISENFESMQTIKYRSTNYSNCSKCCPLAFTQSWSCFLNCSMALSMMVCSQSTQTLTSGCFSSATSCIGFSYTGSCMVLLLPCKPCRWHSTHIELFKRCQSAIKCRCITWKIIHDEPVLMEVMPTCFRGLFFFKHSVYCAKHCLQLVYSVALCLFICPSHSCSVFKQLNVSWNLWQPNSPVILTPSKILLGQHASYGAR